MSCSTCGVSPCEDRELCAILREEEAIKRAILRPQNEHYYARNMGDQMPQNDWLEGFSDGFRGISGYPPRYGPPGASERYWDGYEAGLHELIYC